ncbi:MAG TPA: D-glycerate dehydrogenase [Burkholderiales bacterium]|jgi:glyoxylate reductase|nr:D-glycerate dehydrogenase [Burkholderiales bacterium]
MSRPRIYVTQPVAQSALARLQRIADVDLNPDTAHIATKDELLAAVRTHDVLFCLLHDRVDRDVVTANPALKAIASMKITPSDIDVEEATRRRIPVTVIPPIVTEATADLHMALLLAVARRILEGDKLVRAGVFPGAQSRHLEGVLLADKVLGLIGGGGRIGRAVARRARGFGMKLIYSSPRRKPEAELELGMAYVSLEKLLADSDFVSVHTPLLPETRHQIGEREIGLMKPTAFLVNTARGPIIDEAALARALVERRIAGAGLDVFEHEPQVDSRLLALPNVVLTPHLGSAARELREVMANVVVDNIVAVLEGREPPNCWNREIYASPGAGRA